MTRNPPLPEEPGPALDDVAVVAIGRNEGDRLKKCLQSVFGHVRHVVYVDSGSSDGSVAVAGRMGATVVELGCEETYTAARARNAGLRRVAAEAPDCAFVQFVDGDTEVEPGWLRMGRDHLRGNERLAAVFGRRRERYPERTFYNRLCDMEWRVPAGEARYCGGDVMFRMRALLQVGGYRPDLIAGEEPELSVRLRKQGWKLVSLDAPMTMHDANMTRFTQWWRRTVRTGYAYAQGAALHGAPPERHWVRETRRAWFWGLGVPSATALLTVFFGPTALGLLLVYPAQVARLYLKTRASNPHALLLSASHVLGKVPEAIGQLRFLRDHIWGQHAHIIEYK